MTRRWDGLRVEYGWHPPFEGEAQTKSNRVEVVFSGHSSVILEQDGVDYELNVQPGAMYVVADPSTVLRRVWEQSDTIEMFVDDRYIASIAEELNIADCGYRPTLALDRKIALPVDPIVLGLAHVLRRACLGTYPLSDVGASAIGQALAESLLKIQNPERAAGTSARGRLDPRTLSEVVDYVEANLANQISVLDLANIARLSLFHFTRAFRASMSLPPHQYVACRRLERAKILLMTTDMIVQEIAWILGYENLSHFRRKFYDHFGVTPGVLREMAEE